MKNLLIALSIVWGTCSFANNLEAFKAVTNSNKVQKEVKKLEKEGWSAINQIKVLQVFRCPGCFKFGITMEKFSSELGRKKTTEIVVNTRKERAENGPIVVTSVTSEAQSGEGEEFDCARFQRVICIALYRPAVCTAVVDGEKISVKGSNSCRANASLSYQVCSLLQARGERFTPGSLKVECKDTRSIR